MLGPGAVGRGHTTNSSVWALGRSLCRRRADEPKKASRLQPSAVVPSPMAGGWEGSRTPGKGHMQSGRWEVVPGHPPGQQEAAQPFGQVSGLCREEGGSRGRSAARHLPSPDARPRCWEDRAETASPPRELQPTATLLLCLIFIYFLILTKHHSLGQEQLVFSSPEGMSRPEPAPDRC